MELGPPEISFDRFLKRYVNRLKSMSLFILFFALVPKSYNNDKGFDRLSMRPVQSTLISPRHSRTLLKVSGQIASGVRHFSKRISLSLLTPLRASRGGESRITSASYEDSQSRATKDAILSDALGWYNEVSVPI